MAMTVRAACADVIGRRVELRLQLRVEASLNPGGDDASARRAYASGMTAPTSVSLERTRARQRAMTRLFRPLPVAVAVVVVVTGAVSHPQPGVHGEHLGVLLALVGFSLGVVGVIWTQSAEAPRQVPFFAALVVSSSVLVALQPKGAAFLGAFIAVAAAAMSLRGRPGAAVVLLALVALPVA